MEILGAEKIKSIIKRLAIQIVENNYESKTIYLAGINNNGFAFAKLIVAQLKKISDIDFQLVNIRLNPAKPLDQEITLSLEGKQMKNKVVIIVDDVANTGRTIFYAFKPFMEFVPKKLEVAVLVDRKHKSFPICVDYVGLSLATTMKESIKVDLKKAKERKVELV